MKFENVLKTAAIAGAIAAFTISPAAQAETKLNGSGASFPFPIYAKWFKDFSKANDDFRVDYQAKGSGAGIQDIINGVTNFGGSDAAMKDKEIDDVKAKQGKGVVLLPMTAGEVTLAYNLEGVDGLKLSREAYSKIFCGEITKWNDPLIAASNEGLELPDQAITVVVRSDSSGTSYVFTGHLAAVTKALGDKACKTPVEQAKSPNWPVSDKFLKAPKNDGIAAQLKQIPGAIGYVEYGFAKLTNQPTAALENKAGKFVAAGPESGKAALAGAKFPDATLPGGDVPDLRTWVNDPEGEESYPIASMTWMMFYDKYEADQLKAVHAMIEYCLSDAAQGLSDRLGYIPLPEEVIAKNKEVMQLIK